MPAIDFPAAPAVNDEYSFEGRTWRWNGTGWEVKEYPAALLAGTAANPSLYFSGDPNTGLYSPGADQVAISTGGTERARIDSSGRLLVGTSSARSNFFNYASLVSPGIQLEGVDYQNRMASLVSSNSAGNEGSVFILAHQKSGGVGGNTLLSSGDLIGRVSFQGSDGSEFIEGATIDALIDGTSGANDLPTRLVFSTTADGAASPTERMRISSGGDVTIGSTAIAASRVVTVNAGSGLRALVRFDNSSQVWNTSLKGDGGQNWYLISNPAETVGVYMTPGASGWNNLSDERAKENWVDLENAVQSIKQIRTGTFSWVADKSLPRDVGLIAQDLLKVLPEAVDTSNPDQLGVRYTHVVPLLVAALKEQQEMIEALESRLAAAGI